MAAKSSRFPATSVRAPSWTVWRRRRSKTGASKLYIEDLTKEFVDDYIIPTMKAGATYEQYLLGTSFARPIIAKRIVDIALKEGADAICHGCTGKGNDQVRFELAIHAFAPQMDIIAPWRFWELNSREKEIEYAEAAQHPAEDQQGDQLLQG